MPKSGFKRNGKTVARALHNDPGLIAAQRAAAQKIYDNLPDDVKAEAFITEYDTDRKVIAVVVPADAQAKHGVATRAAGQP